MEKAQNGNKGGAGGGTRTAKNGSTQVIYKKNKMEEKKENQKTKKPTNSIKNLHGQKIGKDVNDDRWQCKICSFKNDKESDVCSMCDSKKGEEKQKH